MPWILILPLPILALTMFVIALCGGCCEPGSTWHIPPWNDKKRKR
jgi:hypothetical protein